MKVCRNTYILEQNIRIRGQGLADGFEKTVRIRVVRNTAGLDENVRIRIRCNVADLNKITRVRRDRNAASSDQSFIIETCWNAASLNISSLYPTIRTRVHRNDTTFYFVQSKRIVKIMVMQIYFVILYCWQPSIQASNDLTLRIKPRCMKFYAIFYHWLHLVEAVPWTYEINYVIHYVP